MNFSIYKNAWKIYKMNFGKLTSFVISIFVVFMAGIVSLLLLSGYDFGITSIVIFAFGLIPLFFSLQMVIGKVSAGRDISYNELYSTYKMYYLPVNRGVYSVIKNSLLAILCFYLSIWLSVFFYDIFNPGNLQAIIDSISQENTIEYYNEIINSVLNLEGYLYYLLIFLSIPFLFFFSKIKDNLMLPYFNMTVGVPSLLAHNLNKKLRQRHKKEIKSVSFIANLLFVISFLVGFIGIGSLAILFEEYLPYVEYILIIALMGGLITSLVFVTPLLITYCFIADFLHTSYMKLVQQKMIEVSNKLESDETLDDAKKEDIKRMLDSFSKEIQKKDSSSKDENHN